MALTPYLGAARRVQGFSTLYPVCGCPYALVCFARGGGNATNWAKFSISQPVTTSALDGASEASVVEAIRALQGKLTILIIAHRGALVSLADRVVEVANGRIISETGIN